MNLKTQDLLVLLKLAVWGQRPWRQEELAAELGLVQSQIHMSLRRAAASGLYDPETKQVNRHGLSELLLHAVRYLVPGQLGPRARGIPTAWGHRSAFHALVSGTMEPPVWSVPAGNHDAALGSALAVDGLAVSPLHEKAPAAAARDPELYEILAAIDALRVGRARDMEIARGIIRKRIA